ncbi:MAG: 16S rRNA (uracil(1498)-N(3))-methyltransferase [Parvularculaceae bacterium]|nr:16S rRNA (uracil(1498)-N(3))-methyltransferase [Parvularculaceae bacterium]
MTPRLHLDAPLEEGANLSLGEGQAHYVRNVLRRVVGDDLKMFNARDGEFAAVVSRADRKAVEILLGARLRPPAPESDLWLLFAPVKRDAVDRIVEKATELGVARLMPIETERTQAHRLNIDRLGAIATEAAEQSGRLSAPKVDELVPLARALENWPPPRRLIYCDEQGDDALADWGGDTGRAPPLLSAIRSLKPPHAVLIGPEGGFSPAERARLRALPFVCPVSLGPRILRADTAAIAALALVQAALGDWR